MTGLMYINQLANGGNVLLFVREYNKETGFATPFTIFGRFGNRGRNIVKFRRKSKARV